jgi:hypothetical protein
MIGVKMRQEKLVEMRVIGARMQMMMIIPVMKRQPVSQTPQREKQPA